MTDGPLLTVREMRRGDWRALASALPKEWLCDELQRLVKTLAWYESADPPGWLIRRIRKALGGDVCRAGAFRIVRSGRWGIAVQIDAAYATFRAQPRRRRVGCSEGGRWDGMFKRLHEEEVERRFTVT